VGFALTGGKLDPAISLYASRVRKGGSYFISPIRLVDTSQSLVAATLSPAYVGYRLVTATNNGVGPTLMLNSTGSAYAPCDNQPQYTDGAITLSQWQVRYVPGTWDTNWNVQIGTIWDGAWYTLNTTRAFQVNRWAGSWQEFELEIRNAITLKIHARAKYYLALT